jgi:phage terminase small subunit
MYIILAIIYSGNIMALSKKRQLFVEEYLISFNATEAAINAGYSKKTAASIGWENLRIPEIANIISQRLEASAMSADEVIMRLAEQARAGHSKYIDEDGEIDLAALIADGKSYLIKGIKDTKYGKQIEFYDSQSALNLLAKHHGLLTDRIEQQSVNLDIDLNDLTDDQLKRLANGESLASIFMDK